MLDKSPNEYLSEAESKMSNLSIDSDTRYSQALELFQGAALSFKRSHNYVRAAETYRRCADCCFHLNKIQDAASNLAESARLFFKCDGSDEIASKTFDTAVKSYKDCGNTDEAIKLCNEFSTYYENINKTTQSIDCLKDAAGIALEHKKEFEYQKCMKRAGELYIKSKNWGDAAKHFEEFAYKQSENSITSETHELAMICIICSLYTGSVAAARGALDRVSKNISTWANSGEFKLAKDFVDSGMTKIESRIKKSSDNIIGNKQKNKLLVELASMGLDIIQPKKASQ